MKQVHNVRVRIHNSSRVIVDEVLTHASALAQRSTDDTIETSVTEDDGLIIGELWLDRQQPVRRFLAALLAGMSEDDKKKIREQPTKHLDTGTHCFLHLKREKFVTGEYALVDKPSGTVSVRLNIACWPANKENAVKTMQEIFS